MSPFYIVLTIILGTLGLILIVIFRIYYRNHARNKERKIQSGKSKDDLEDIKKKENFRQFIRNFLQKY